MKLMSYCSQLWNEKEILVIYGTVLKLFVSLFKIKAFI
jgi:hypothetical protein